jgi:hypothetical protein
LIVTHTQAEEKETGKEDDEFKIPQYDPDTLGKSLIANGEDKTQEDLDDGQAE